MPRRPPKSRLTALDELTATPPPAPLPPAHVLARIAIAAGQNLFNVQLPSGTALLVELAPIFRRTTWLRRGGYVLVNTAAFKERENKIGGEIVNVVRNEREWRAMPYWPDEFTKRDEGDEEESVVGKLPPNSDEETEI